MLKLTTSYRRSVGEGSIFLRSIFEWKGDHCHRLPVVHYRLIGQTSSVLNENFLSRISQIDNVNDKWISIGKRHLLELLEWKISDTSSDKQFSLQLSLGECFFSAPQEPKLKQSLEHSQLLVTDHPDDHCSDLCGICSAFVLLKYLSIAHLNVRMFNERCSLQNSEESSVFRTSNVIITNGLPMIILVNNPLQTSRICLPMVSCAFRI